MEGGSVSSASMTEQESGLPPDIQQKTSTYQEEKHESTEHNLPDVVDAPTDVVDVGVPEDIPDIALPREEDARPDLQAADVASSQSTIRLSPLSDLDNLQDDDRNAMVMHEPTRIPAPIRETASTTTSPAAENKLSRVHFDHSPPLVLEDSSNTVHDKEDSLMSDLSDPANLASPVANRSGILNSTIKDDETEEGEIAEDEEEDEDDVVIRPRSRGKRTTVSQEPEAEEPLVKKIKAEAAAIPAAATVASTAAVATASATGVHINEEDDEEGNTKVTEHGELKGDRTYTSRAFRLPMRGDTFYFLATEIARVSGYRDSYLLFNKNRNLKKLMTTEAEKAFLIQQELIPYSYRNRQIGVVNALSIYKTFGARVITRGMRVKDDYFAQRARDQGFTEADYANEEDRPVEDRLFAQAEAQRRAETDADVALASKAQNAVEYNASVNQQRKARNALLRQHYDRIIHL